MTGSYRRDVADLLGKRGRLRHTAHVEMQVDTGAVTLPITDGTVTIEEDRAPRFQASLTTPLPAASVYDQLDPRSVSRLAIFAGYSTPTWDSNALLFTGVLTDRGVFRPAGTMTLAVDSTERVVLDCAATPPGVTVAGGARTGIARRVVDLAFATGRTWVETTSDAASISTPDLSPTSKWAVVRDMLDQVGADAYDRGDGTWVMEYRPTTAGTIRHTLTPGPDGTLYTSTSRTSRGDGFANRVQLVYEWRTGSTDNKVVAIRDVTAGPLAVAAGNVVTYRETRDVATTQTLANAAATELLARLAARGQTYEVSGPAAYWLRPGMTVELTLPIGGSIALIVSRVRFQIGTGDMDLSLRVPDLTTTIGAPA